MISELCYAIVFIIETIISIFYFNKKFRLKRNYGFVFIIASISSFVSFSIAKLNIPLLNLLSFFIFNFIIIILCYEVNIKSSLFHPFLLISFMIVTEILVFFVFSVLFSIDLDACFRDQYILIIQASISKLLYFIVVYFSAKFSSKEYKSDKSYSSLFLCILPAASISFMYTSIFLCITYNVNETFKFALVICNLLSLLSNIVVFYVHDKTVKTNQKYTELLLTQQKEDNRVTYYELLKEQNENSKVLIHDITKHLNSLKMLSTNNNSDIVKYIDNIENDFDIMNPIDYSNNALLNLITNRYYKICKSEKICFDINIQNTQINFMSDPDITSLFDNLLANSTEAARQSKNRFIVFSIDIRNSNFLVISVLNSSDTKPLQINDSIVSSKKDPKMHGIGIKSIKRVVKKYDGIMTITYNDKQKTFSTTITFQLNNSNVDTICATSN
ncbi:MAG: GHKL domain-containing protein [Ruminococcus sp.]|nr:GHKL domain-containing protein [Ruminococcus sp.]